MHSLQIVIQGSNLSFLDMTAKMYDILDTIEYNLATLTTESERAFYQEFIETMEEALESGRLHISLQKDLGEEYPTHTLEQIVEITDTDIRLYVQEQLEIGDKKIKECYKIDTAGVSYI